MNVERLNAERKRDLAAHYEKEKRLLGTRPAAGGDAAASSEPSANEARPRPLLGAHEHGRAAAQEATHLHQERGVLEGLRERRLAVFHGGEGTRGTRRR